MLVGFTWFLGGISSADNPYVFTFGVACNAVALGFLAHLLLAFPSGRLSSRRQVALAAGAYALAVVANPVILLFADPASRARTVRATSCSSTKTRASRTR